MDQVSRQMVRGTSVTRELALPTEVTGAGSRPEVSVGGSAGESTLTQAVFQVLAPDGGAAGAGFLVTGATAFTCAHVVRAAGHDVGDRVEVVFPGLTGAPRVAAHVLDEGWRAPEAEDIAVLRLEEVPAQAAGLPVGTSAGARGRRVYSYGFPAQAPPAGHFGNATVGGLLAAGDGAGQLLQLAQANDVATGFSGGPVLDESTGLVIGMVTALVSPDAHLRGMGIAYATPTEVLREACPQVAEHHICPYLGLEPFSSQHAAWFHGRDRAVEKVLGVLGAGRRMALLLGPSGAGKSSLVNAGVLPALAQGALPGSGRWLSLYTRPGRNLLTALEDAGLSGAADDLAAAVEARLDAEPRHDHLLLVIDQFEELLTQGGSHGEARAADDVRLQAARQLVALAHSATPATVLLVMRNDFYAPLDALAPDLLNTAFPGLCNLPATLSRADLTAIITRPAAAVGLELEAGLAERIARDVLDVDSDGRQAPATLLPPLELALRQLWLRCRPGGGRLTHAAYDKTGRIAGSMTAWGNHTLAQLPAAHRPTAQRLLTALVRPADEAAGTPAARQLVPLARLRTLAAEPDLPEPEAEAAFESVVAAMAGHRLIVTDTTGHPATIAGEPAAELIHDALIRDWTDLRDWVARDQQFYGWLHRAAEQQSRYAQSSLPGDLLDGSLLAEGQEWAIRRRLPAEIQLFLEASRHHHTAAHRRTRRLSAILACFLALALTATGVAFYQQHTATVAQRAATKAQHAAQSRQLAAQSVNLHDSNPDVASLLAVKAWKTAHTEEAAAALHAAPAVPLRRTFTDAGRNGVVPPVAFSPDGQTLGTGSEHGPVTLVNAETGKTQRILVGHHGFVWSVAFSADGRTFATGGEDGSVRLWDVRSGRTRITLSGAHGLANSVVFSPDGKTIATGLNDGSVGLWDTSTGKRRATFTGDHALAQSLAFSPDGETLATGSEDVVRLWSVRTGRVRTTLTGHEGLVNSVAFSPHGGLLATGGEDDTVRLWNAETGKAGPTLTDNNSSANALAFSPDGTSLASGYEDGVVRLWDVASGKTHTRLTGHDASVWSVTFSPDGRTLASGGYDGTVRLWKAELGPISPTLSGHDGFVNAVTFSPDGETLASGSYDGTVRLWDVRSGETHKTLTSRDKLVESVAFSPDGKTLATASHDGPARLWNRASGAIRTTLPGHTGLANAVAFSSDGAFLATGGEDSIVRLWDVRNGQSHTPLPGHDGAVHSVAFSRDSRTLMTSSEDNTVRLWDVKTGRTRTTLSDHKGPVNAVAISPDGTLVVTGSEDGPARLWDAKSGKPRTTLVSRDGFVREAAFSPDGKTFATAGEDGTVRLWDAQSGKPRTLLTASDRFVYSMAFSPHGELLATGSRDGTVRVRHTRLPSPEKISHSICVALDRDFTADERETYLKGQDHQPVCAY